MQDVFGFINSEFLADKRCYVVYVLRHLQHFKLLTAMFSYEDITSILNPLLSLGV